MNSFHKLASNRKGAPKSFEDTVFPKLHESGYWPNPVTSIALDQEKTVHLGSWVAVKGAGECKTRYGFVNRFPFRVLNPPNAERLPREFLAKINICYLVQASELPEDVRVPLALSSTQVLLSNHNKNIGVETIEHTVSAEAWRTSTPIGMTWKSWLASTTFERRRSRS